VAASAAQRPLTRRALVHAPVPKNRINRFKYFLNSQGKKKAAQ
jgi:hypothetical protein